MEHRQTISDAHPKPILSLQYNPARKEIYSGGEEGVIRVWDETGKLTATLTEHVGWITALLYCKECKILFSCAIDGMLIAWGPNNVPIQKIETGLPIYSLAYNDRRQQIMVGCNKEVKVFQMISNEDNHTLLEVLERKPISCAEHTDLVSCMVSCEGRFYSAGYDRKIVIYDVPHHGNLKLRVSNVLQNAHDAAISCMVYGKDADNNSWLITGSFDRSVKLWSLDGNLLQRFDGLLDTVTSLCYVIPTQTLWIAANSSTPVIYDPKSGANVSEFVRTGDDEFSQIGGGFAFKQLLFVPEMNQVLGATNRKSIVIWKFNECAALTILPGHTDVVECLTFTSKEPLLVFSGGDDGQITKWERLQLNTFMYSKEHLHLQKEEKYEEEPMIFTFSRNPEERRKKQAAMHKKVSAKLHSWERVEEDPESLMLLSADARRTLRKKDHDIDPENRVLKKKRLALDTGDRNCGLNDDAKAAKPGVVSLLYYEELDILISGYEDSKIHVWGYNEEAVKFNPEDVNGETDMEAPGLSNDSVTNRVAGMSLKYTLQEHKDAVIGVACFKKDETHWLITTGFDRRICVWEYIMPLNMFEKRDIFRNASNGLGREELAADGIILDLEYCLERNEFAYASADKLAYIRKFSPRGTEMLLQAVLQGHEAEVTQVKWCGKNHQWITASEDRTVRIWPAEGIPCLRIINNDAPVTALCIDKLNGSIITGAQDKVIRVFDPDKKDELVQKNIGHGDEVRSIIHIPARNQYVSCSWDNTVRVWNAYRAKGQRRIVAKSASIASHQPQIGIFDEPEEHAPAYADLNPLIKPKLLMKSLFVPELLQKATNKEERDVLQEQSRFEEELRFTLNELETALASSDKTQSTRKTRIKPPVPIRAEKRKGSESKAQ